MPERPNILLIMTDQQRGDCLSCERRHPVLTPNMDSIAGAGVRFTHCYTPVTTCIGARRSLLSGQEPATHGMVGYRDCVEWDAPATLPGVLSEAGYHTYLVGRSMHQHPPRKRYGYEHMVLHGWASDYGEWLDAVAGDGHGGPYGAGVMHNDWTACPWHLPDHMSPTNWTVSEALKFLKRRDPSCPFFLTVSFVAPHPPLNPPAFYLERYLRTGVREPVIGDWAERPPNDGIGLDVSNQKAVLEGEELLSARAAYYGHINHVDDQIRRLLNPVRNDWLRNTIVVFTSDHGEMLGDHYLWRKNLSYEPSARVPLLVRAPKEFGIAVNSLAEQPVTLCDIMPTLLEMTGCDIPETVEGRSLLPLLRAEAVEWRPWVHVEHAPRHQSLTDGGEKYIWNAPDGREQFFDLTADPDECHDLIHDPARRERIAWWRSQLIEKLQDRPEGFTDGERLTPGRPYKSCLPWAGRLDEGFVGT